MTLVNAQPIPARNHRWRVVAVTLAAVLLAGLISGSAQAALVRDREADANAPREVFGAIAAAWEAGDEETLASFVHGDGLRVMTTGNGQQGKRVSHYSPSQAHYYFRNLFQAQRTLLFEFEMMQDATAGTRVHGMATWKRRRPDSEHVNIVKLVCILVQQDDRWLLAEINTIR